MQCLGQRQVTPQGLQHMLPGANGVGVANFHALVCGEGAQDIGHQPVCRPVAAAQHIAGPCRCHGNTVARMVGGVEVGRAIAGGHQFGASLAVAVGVIAAHGFVLAVAPDPFAVFVALVGGYVHHGAHARRVAHAFQQVHGAHDVRGVGLHRVVVGVAHQGLGRQVQHDLGSRGLHGGLHGGQVTDIADDRGHAFGNAGLRKQTGLGGGGQGVACDLRSHLLQPERQPASLEAGVAGQEDAFAAPELRIHAHTFQGAWPVLHSSSR